MYVKNLILGAGISGLAFAKKMSDMGEQSVVFEAENYHGGLCHSFKINGFTFDSAVHLSFTEDPVARKFFDATPYHSLPAVSYNFYHGQWLKHPIINNLYKLPIQDKVSYIKSFLERNDKKTIGNYKDWLYASYGDKMTEDFYGVYTRKYWGVPPEALSVDWVGKRLATPDLDKLLTGAMTDETGNDYYAKEMRYPDGNGGYETFLNPLLEGIEIQYQKKAVEIDLKDKFVTFQDHTKCHYDRLISSIPLPYFISIVKDCPADLLVQAAQLEATKISLVSVGFNKPDVPKYLWFYIYDEDIWAARVNSPSMKSIQNVPEGCSSLQFEIYHNREENISKKAILENVRYALKKMRICKEEDILFMDYRLLPWGNVVFKKDMEIYRDKILKYLNNRNVTSIGRFGKWEYYWSDQSYLSGMQKFPYL